MIKHSTEREGTGYNPDEREVSSHLMLQKINIEAFCLSLRKKNCQPSYLNSKLILPKNQRNATPTNIDSICKMECQSPETADQYHSLYAKKCKNNLNKCLPITLLRKSPHPGSVRLKIHQDMS